MMSRPRISIAKGAGDDRMSLVYVIPTADQTSVVPGNVPFIANATVTTVISVLSAMGSITVPTTV